MAAGVRARWTIGLLVVGVVGAVLAVKARPAAPTTSSPASASFTDPHHDPQGAAYNVNQAHIAIANGGLFGTGLFHGPQTNGGFVPEQQTDFVFSVAGEEFGLVGGVGDHRAVRRAVLARPAIARRADRTGQLVAVGIVCWFAFQAFQNIGMNLGLMPVTGLPLPFVSYGGSSMFAQGLAIGVLHAIRRTSLIGADAAHCGPAATSAERPGAATRASCPTLAMTTITSATTSTPVQGLAEHEHAGQRGDGRLEAHQQPERRRA